MRERDRVREGCDIVLKLPGSYMYFSTLSPAG